MSSNVATPPLGDLVTVPPSVAPLPPCSVSVMGSVDVELLPNESTAAICIAGAIVAPALAFDGCTRHVSAAMIPGFALALKLALWPLAIDAETPTDPTVL